MCICTVLYYCKALKTPVMGQLKPETNVFRQSHNSPLEMFSRSCITHAGSFPRRTGRHRTSLRDSALLYQYFPHRHQLISYEPCHLKCTNTFVIGARRLPSPAHPQVQSTINHDNLVISLAPFLLSLSPEEEFHTTNKSAILKEKLI